MNSDISTTKNGHLSASVLLSKRQDLNLRPLRPEPVPGRILKRSQMSRSGQKWCKINIFRALRFFDIMFLSKNRQRILLHFYCSPALIGLWNIIYTTARSCRYVSFLFHRS